MERLGRAVTGREARRLALLLAAQGLQKALDEGAVATVAGGADEDRLAQSIRVLVAVLVEKAGVPGVHYPVARLTESFGAFTRPSAMVDDLE